MDWCNLFLGWSLSYIIPHINPLCSEITVTFQTHTWFTRCQKSHRVTHWSAIIGRSPEFYHLFTYIWSAYLQLLSRYSFHEFRCASTNTMWLLNWTVVAALVVGLYAEEIRMALFAPLVNPDYRTSATDADLAVSSYMGAVEYALHNIEDDPDLLNGHNLTWVHVVSPRNGGL